MTSDNGVTVDTSAVLEAARLGRTAPESGPASLPGVAVLGAPSVSGAAARAIQHWSDVAASMDRSTDASASLLVECIAAYGAADERVDGRMSGLLTQLEQSRARE